MSGVTELSQILRNITPVLHDETFVFCSLSLPLQEAIPLAPMAIFMESEGMSLVIPQSIADGYRIGYEMIFKMITLTIHSSLESVGLTAAVSQALAKEGISANVIAGYYHDHIFVPYADAERAYQTLDNLQQEAVAAD